jgi:hypothetical protein
MNIKTGPLTKGTIHTHRNSNRLLKDLTTNNYIDIVYKEFQDLFNFKFGELVRGIRAVFNKVMLLMTNTYCVTMTFILFPFIELLHCRQVVF